MPRNASPQSYQTPKSQAAGVIQGILRTLGKPSAIVRLAGLDPKTKEGLAFKRSIERTREDKPKGGKQASTKVSEKNLALLEKAAAASGKTVAVTVSAQVSRRAGEPAQWRTFTERVPMDELLRAPKAAVIANAPIPTNYYATRGALAGDPDELAALTDEELAELEEAAAEAIEIEDFAWE